MGISHFSIKNNKEDCHELNSSRNDELKKLKTTTKQTNKNITIMKKVLLSILAVAAMASCVQSEDVNPQQLIDFGSPFVGGTTKAADPSYGEGGEDLTLFNVYGTVNAGEGVVNIFDGVEVTGTVGGGVWSYGAEHKQYWFEGAIYNFAAVVDAETVAKDAYNMPTTLTPAKNGEYLKDLLYADAGPITAAEPYSPVNFEFKHLLAKAQFVVTSTTESGYYYKVEDIKIHNFSTGTYTISTGAWATAVENAKAYELGDIAKVSADDAQGVTNTTQVLLIPTTTDFEVEFVVRLYNDNGTPSDTADDVLMRTINCTDANAKTVETDLVKGYAYNFNLALTSGTEIQFTVTGNPTWTDGNISL